MTQEEKAKAYDEAKLRMSAAYNSNRCTIGFMNEIFPELKESDDKKIMKDIVTYLKSDIANKGYRDKIIESWIAWLENIQYAIEHAKREGFQLGYKAGIEKQGEKYSVWVGGGEINDEYLTKEDAEKLADKYKKEGYDDVVIEKQAERKPIKEHNVCDFCDEKHGCVNPCPTKLIEEQKPEVDQHSLPVSDNSSLPTFDESIYHPCTEKVYEQKPAEWNEDDESRMDNLCHFLEEYGNQYYGHLTLQGTISWLKSLRPQSQWKPSEEQVNALNDVISSRDIKYDVLSELWKDLEKLRNE